MNKMQKRIILFFVGCIILILLLAPAIENFKTKNEYEKQRQEINRKKYEKYFGGDNDK